MAKINKLIDGYKKFYLDNYIPNQEHFKLLASEGQFPKTLVVSCSDSRVDPSTIMNTSPGDIFVVRNVANLVPPYQPDQATYHGTSAGIEFAVKHLNVEHIIVMGHSGCGGIKALVENDGTTDNEFSFIQSWIDIANDAKLRALEKCKNCEANKYATCEKESIITSVNNLLTFPYINKAVAEETLDVNGWYFSISDGKIHVLEDNKSFKEI